MRVANLGGSVRVGGWISLLAVGVLAIGACEGILDVDSRDVITPDDLEQAGPAGVPTLVNGMAGTVHRAVGAVVRYSALLSDEMILAGTFPDRAQVDRRRILESNGAVTEELYVPLHAARFQADTTVLILSRRLDDPDFATVRDRVEEGIALGRLYGGLTRIWLAEHFCWSILSGLHQEDSPLFPDERMEQALLFLAEAESLAGQAGLEEIRVASVVGQARARLWLRDYDAAFALAAEVPGGALFQAEFSRSNPDQFNSVYVLTWGDTDQIRWTVGDGTSALRGNEAWEYLEVFRSLNLIRDRPSGFTSFQGSIPVLLQMRYGRAESSIPITSGIEAALIRAETLVRAGRSGEAEGILNGLRSDFHLRAALGWGVTPAPPADVLAPISLSGSVETDVRRVAGERARELWLTGDRLPTARRLRLDPEVAIDLLPPVKTGIGGGDDAAFPIVQRELMGNPRLEPEQACPPGQVPGGWR